MKFEKIILLMFFYLLITILGYGKEITKKIDLGNTNILYPDIWERNIYVINDKFYFLENNDLAMYSNIGYKQFFSDKLIKTENEIAKNNNNIIVKNIFNYDEDENKEDNFNYRETIAMYSKMINYSIGKYIYLYFSINQKSTIEEYGYKCIKTYYFDFPKYIYINKDLSFVYFGEGEKIFRLDKNNDTKTLDKKLVKIDIVQFKEILEKHKKISENIAKIYPFEEIQEPEKDENGSYTAKRFYFFSEDYDHTGDEIATKFGIDILKETENSRINFEKTRTTYEIYRKLIK